MEKNIYGLSEGVFKACQYLGLKFPDAINGEHIPSDYFGDDFEFDSAMRKKLRSKSKLPSKRFSMEYKNFSNKFASQKPLKQTKTDLNIYFCDHVLHSPKTGASLNDYFDFEFYRKSFALRDKFLTQKHRSMTRVICNDACNKMFLNNKAKTNALFADFLRRDWLSTQTCTFVEFQSFVEKHPRFFAKPIIGSFGVGAQIISVDLNKNLKKIFANLKRTKRILEEVVTQHKDLQAFCPDTVNTIRVNTFLDLHNVVHILTTGGRFGRVGKVVDNFHGGGFSVTIDPKTGIIISDGINRLHERVEKHPDTGKIFKGFQYPVWEKVRAAVTEMAKLLPQMRHIGWDIAINDKSEVVLIEANVSPDVDVQQAPDDTGRLHLYAPFLEELQKFKSMQMKFIGWRVNDQSNFDLEYDYPSRKPERIEFALRQLVPGCESLLDLGCRKEKFAKALCSEGVKYFPVDFKKHDDEVIACNFNKGEFPDLKVDTCLCAFTAEFVELLPQFLDNMCAAAQKQILMLCRPADKEDKEVYRWLHPLLTDFTEKFLIKTLAQNKFRLNAKKVAPASHSVILYDFRRI